MSEFENNIIAGSNGTPKTSGVGALIGTVVIIIILIAGGWYFVSNRIEKQRGALSNNNTATEFSTSAMSTSSEIIDIQKDLDALNFDVLDNQ